MGSILLEERAGEILVATCLRKVLKCCMRLGLQEMVVSFTRSSDIIRNPPPFLQAYGFTKFVLLDIQLPHLQMQELLHYPAKFSYHFIPALCSGSQALGCHLLFLCLHFIVFISKARS